MRVDLCILDIIILSTRWHASRLAVKNELLSNYMA